VSLTRSGNVVVADDRILLCRGNECEAAALERILSEGSWWRRGCVVVNRVAMGCEVKVLLTPLAAVADLCRPRRLCVCTRHERSGTGLIVCMGGMIFGWSDVSLPRFSFFLQPDPG